MQPQPEFNLWEYICKEPADVRMIVLDVLSMLNNPVTIPTFARALSDPYWKIRIIAAQVLGEFRREVSAQLLIDALYCEMDEMVRASLVRALGMRCDPQTAEIFASILLKAEEDCLVRESAAWALGTLEEQAPPHALVYALLNDPDELVRKAAAHSLGLTKKITVEFVLQKAIEDADSSVREAASWALEHLRESNQPKNTTEMGSLVNPKKIAYRLKQEGDITRKAIQELMHRMHEYIGKAERGEEEVAKVLACLRMTMHPGNMDQRLHKKRLHMESYICPVGFVDKKALSNKVADEDPYHESLFHLLANRIAQFPSKQRDALLAELASRMVFDEKPTVLQAAFQAEGITLEEYRQLQPATEQTRAHRAALLYQAYQRLREQMDSEISYLIDMSQGDPH